MIFHLWISITDAGSILIPQLLSSISCSLLPLCFEKTSHPCRLSTLSHAPFPPFPQCLPLLLSSNTPNQSWNVLPLTHTPTLSLLQWQRLSFSEFSLFCSTSLLIPFRLPLFFQLPFAAQCPKMQQKTYHILDDSMYFGTHSAPQKIVQSVWLIQSSSFPLGSCSFRVDVHLDCLATQPTSMSLCPGQSDI